MKTYKFFRQETGEWEEVDTELWRWEAIFEDGTNLKQFSDDGTFHQFKEIDQSKLAFFKMVSSETNQTYTILFSDPEMKLIHYYKNSILNAGTENEKKVKMYCFGYEKKVGTKVIKNVFVITPNNETIITIDPEIIKIS